LLSPEEGAGHTRVSLEHRLFERMGRQGGEKMRGEVDNGWPKLLAFSRPKLIGQPRDGRPVAM